MRKSFNFNLAAQSPARLARIVIATLAALNLIAVWFVMHPPGGSPDELHAQVRDLTVQLRQRRASLDRTRVLVSKIESGREQGDAFLAKYFLPRRTAYSIIVGEINDLAKQSQMRSKESTFNIEPIEGSDTLSLMTISANFEGKYADLMHFINALDKSQRLLIVDSLGATPQSNGT